MDPAAARAAGHLGELIQGRLGPSGPVALVTLPCPALAATARLAPGPFALRDPARLLPRRDAEALLACVADLLDRDAEASEAVLDAACRRGAASSRPGSGTPPRRAGAPLRPQDEPPSSGALSADPNAPGNAPQSSGAPSADPDAPGDALQPSGPLSADPGAPAGDARLPRPPSPGARQAPGHGRLRLRADMPAGGGAGASTAARLAILRAAARAAGAPPLSPEAAARLCLSQEGATDPLMFPDPAARLWASRLARTVAALPPLPRFDVVGGFDGPPRRTDPADQHFADVADLAAAWAPAAARGDLAALAALATASAERHEALRGIRLGALRAAALANGALGLAVAHTGSARALLFAPGAGDPVAAAAALRGLGLRGVLRFRTGGRP